jgi:CheY-like chemotaxis protein
VVARCGSQPEIPEIGPERPCGLGEFAAVEIQASVELPRVVGVRRPRKAGFALLSSRLLRLIPYCVTALLLLAGPAQAQVPTTKPTPLASVNPSASGALPTPPSPDPVTVLLSQVNEYKKLLLEENRQHVEFLNTRVDQTVRWITTAIASIGGLLVLLVGIATFVFHRNFAEFKQAIRERTEREAKAIAETMLAQSQTYAKAETERVIASLSQLVLAKAQQIDSRAEQADRANQRRGEKYAGTLRQILDVLIDTNPDVLNKLCHVNLAALPNLKGKKVLWVDDDPVSIVLLVAILERLGMQVAISLSTEAALSCDFSALHLVITNMNREPIHDDGLKLAHAIRSRHHCEIPILIFTRPDRVRNYISEMETLKVEYATELDEFISKLTMFCNGEHCNDA